MAALSGPAGRYLFDELGRVFNGRGDPIEAYLARIRVRERSGEKRKAVIPIKFGRTIENRTITLQPGNEARLYTGRELCEAIAERYNEEYWLITLWNKLLENARNTAIGTDLVRAFIKHGIYLTGEELASYNCEIDASFVALNGLKKRVKYYQELFEWGSIFSCLRMPQRRLVVRRLHHNHDARIGFTIRNASTAQLLAALPEINQVLGYSQLPQIVRDAHEQTENLRGIVSSIYLQWQFWRDSRKLKAALKEVLRSNQILTSPKP